MNYLHIDAGPRVLTGDEAREALARDNDAEFLTPGRGIEVVSRARWMRAQAAEHTHWFDPSGRGRRIADDRNIEHFERFDGYQCLVGERYEEALEIGCGPFTNLRLIGKIARPDGCQLLDPSIKSYLSHGYSYFNEDSLTLVPPSRTLAKTWGHLPSAGRRAMRGVLPQLPISKLIESGGESAPKDSADLVVMINVIEHCMDARKLLRAAAGAVRPGGTLVLADKFYDAGVLDESATRVFDAAHPLRITNASIEQLLTEFGVLYDRDYPSDPEILKYLPKTVDRYLVLRRL